ncbi:serine protease 42-like [Artibeus jamaicensis]|uniref:serine protease 42-like n=1 Tax=Artibeus jamaicensis TaxID=9417 RepID=UPI00235B082D|nr:serine protease 42-like [Artibeus jamaicensis]
MLVAGSQGSASPGRCASDTHAAASPLTPTSREESLLLPRAPGRPAAALLCSVPLAAPGNRSGAGRDELTPPPARPPRPNSLQMPGGPTGRVCARGWHSVAPCGALRLASGRLPLPERLGNPARSFPPSPVPPDVLIHNQVLRLKSPAFAALASFSWKSRHLRSYHVAGRDTGKLGVPRLIPRWLLLTSAGPVCGHVLTKIVGGQDVQEGEWPWQVSLRVSGRHVCGGTLIAQQWVLTAGHCILRRHHYSVKMGDRSVFQEITSVVVPVKSITVHPRYSTIGTIHHDLALLQLHYPVNFTVTIHPICIPDATFKVAAGTRCWVTGWGRTQEFGGKLVSFTLQKVDQFIIYYEKCNEMMKKATRKTKDLVLPGMICGYKDVGKDSCQGDSGGPLVCDYDDTWVQMGIVSWGFGCGRREVPGVYTDVAVYSKWIVGVVNQVTVLSPAVLLIMPLCLGLPLGLLVTP